jgi:hypothetical protein
MFLKRLSIKLYDEQKFIVVFSLVNIGTKLLSKLFYVPNTYSFFSMYFLKKSLHTGFYGLLFLKALI